MVGIAGVRQRLGDQKGQGQEELSPEGSYYPFLPPSEMKTKGVTKQWETKGLRATAAVCECVCGGAGSRQKAQKMQCPRQPPRVPHPSSSCPQGQAAQSPS